MCSLRLCDLLTLKLFSIRFLISLCNPNDKQNTEVMIHLGLTLLTVAFEVGADHIGNHATLLALVKDDLCRNLFSVRAHRCSKLVFLNPIVFFLVVDERKNFNICCRPAGFFFIV